MIVALLSIGMNSALPVVAVSSYSERTKLLREILSSKEMTIMPCCYDGLSARLVEQSGIISCETRLESFLVINSIT